MDSFDGHHDRSTTELESDRLAKKLPKPVQKEKSRRKLQDGSGFYLYLMGSLDLEE